MYRFGIVGAGAIAEKFAEDIKATKNATLVAVASRDMDRANSFKERHNLDYAFGNYKEMATSDVIDVAYIATPHNFHKDQSILFMENGKHVLCEKAISSNNLELQEMIKIAKKNHVLLMEAMWTRYLPVTTFVKNIVDSKKFGEIVSLDFNFGFKVPDDYDIKKRLLNPHLAGGSLLDLGVYPISSALFYCTDDIFNIDAKCTFHQTGVDGTTDVVIQFDNGVLATLQSSILMDTTKKGIITFKNHTIEIPFFWMAESCYVDGVEQHFPFKAGGFEYQIDAFTDTLDKGLLENDIMSHYESTKVMEVMDDVRQIIGFKYPFE